MDGGKEVKKETKDPNVDVTLPYPVAGTEAGANDMQQSTNETENEENDKQDLTQVKLMDAAAELATRRVELEALKIEEERQAIFRMLEQKHKEMLEEHRREMKRLETERLVAIAEAKLKAFTAITKGNYQPPSEFTPQAYDAVGAEGPHSQRDTIPQLQTNSVVATSTSNIDISSQSKGLDPTAPSFKLDTNETCHYYTTNQESGLTGAQAVDLSKIITESMNLGRLPVPEPSVFSGDPLRYTEWKIAFHTLIERKGISDDEKIFYLRKYVTGEARQAIEGFFYTSSSSAYSSAKKILEERYGHPFVLQRAFRNKLDNWPRVAEKDSRGLREFGDFLQACCDATTQVPSLQILDDCTENQKLLRKLPSWAIHRWNRKVQESLDTSGSYPTFRQFVSFVVGEGRIACNPVSSPLALNEQHWKVTGNKSAGVKVLATSAVMSNEFKGKVCLYCEKEHFIVKCHKFTSLPIQEKRAFIREKNLCYGCLRKGHRNNQCQNKHTCSVCKGKHPTCLHEENSPVRRLQEQTPQDMERVTSFRVSQMNGQGTSMIVPVWVSTERNPSCEVLTYALLDTQSDVTFILDDVAAALQVTGEDVKLSLSTMTSQHTVINSNKVCGLRVRSFHSSNAVSINKAFTRDFIPADRTHIPVKETLKTWRHLKQLTNELPPLQSCEVGLLIGYNCPQALAPRKILLGRDDEPYAVQTILGWSIVGYTSSGPQSSCFTGITHRTTVKELPRCTPQDVLKSLELDFAHDKGDDIKFSQDDLQFLQILGEGIHQREDGHYEMPLPFKKRPHLPNNKTSAAIRLEHLKRKFRKDTSYHDQYKACIDDMLKRGAAEKIETTADEGKVWYVPHHGVRHPRKLDKLRIVFDCSATYKSTALNQHLLTGPDITNGLTGVLCRFRKFPVAIMCDIERMFHQFYVNEEDRDFLRFLWWENGNIDSAPSDYRMRVHLFGAASSPGCANYALKHLAKGQEKSFPQASQFIQNDFYVDDGVTSVETEEEGIKLIKSARYLCSMGGLRLHKFASNNLSVLNSLPLFERASNKEDPEMAPDERMEHALGVRWNIMDDFLFFKVAIKSTSPTRRSMLSVVASVFDPLGFLSPLILVGKRMLQEMCRSGTGWDDPLPDVKIPEWERWSKDLQTLDIKIPRCIIPPDFSKPTRIELHHFSDASNSGYGQCSYIRVIKDERVHCALLTGKARVIPMKVVTIPRLELTAAVLSVKMSYFLKRELNLIINVEYFWTDSQVVLGYINNEARRFHVFVANRVQIIRDATNPNQWLYIDSASNPADFASRGLSADELKSTSWLTGPSFLWQRQFSTESIDTQLQIGDPEIRQFTSLCTKTTSMSGFLKFLTRCSSWPRVVSMTARLQRLSNGVKGTHSPCVEERKRAETTIIKLIQREAFPDTMKLLQSTTALPRTNSLYHLDPFIQDGLIRVGGRMQNADLSTAYKHPVILPKESHITQLILAHIHTGVCHQGRGITLNQLRVFGYWIVGGSKIVAKFIRKCVTCRKLRRPTELQQMADLPKDRVEPSPPFTYCGMDCFGPFFVKIGRQEIKRYGLLFTCMCSRAIHIEMLDDMTTDAFINSLRCFIAIRGYVRQIRSDHGTNFIGGKNELQNSVNSNKVNAYLAEKHCDFIMNTPGSSHSGGVWERQIRTVRNILNTVLMLSHGRLDDSSLRTLFYEAMSIVNCRPLTVSEIDDPKILEPLTPNHILTAKYNIPPPPAGKFVKEDVYLRKRWRRVQYLLEQFWSRWKREYMAQITLRQKWHEPKRNMKTGDIVLVTDVDLPRNQWPLARVIETSIDKDGLVRKVKVQLGCRGSNQRPILERSIHKLVLLIEN